MDQLKIMKEQLIAQVQSQMGNLSSVDAKEMGEVVDMIKDLAEATYYCTVTEAMEKGAEEREGKQSTNTYYYTEKMIPQIPYDYWRDMDRPRGVMYYNGSTEGNNSSNGNNNGGGRYYEENRYPMNEMRHIHDMREGRSALSRKSYMESKELHKDKGTQMQELERYVTELGQDITEMIQDTSPEEKQMLQQKIMGLANRIK